MGEDRDRQRLRQWKMKADSLCGPVKWQLPDSWQHPRVMKAEVDEDGNRRRQTHSGDEQSGSSLTADNTPEWWRWNLILFLSCDLLTPEPMKDAAVFAAPGPPQSSCSWTSFQENVGYEALTVPSGRANLSDRRLLALRPELSDVLYSSFLTVLCVLSIYFSLFHKAQHIWFANHIKQTDNRVLVGQFFHNIPSRVITFPSVQDG